MDKVLVSVNRQISNGIIHGAVVLVGSIDTNLYSGVFGVAEPQKNIPMQIDSIFDIASITKVVGTNSALLLAIEDGKINVDSPFTDYLPKFRTKLKEKITVRMLASHVSGISMAYPQVSPPEVMRDAFMDIVFPEEALQTYQYTCTAFILLGMIVESVMGRRLKNIVAERVFDKLGMFETYWTKVPEEALERTIRTINADPGIISDPGARIFYPEALGNAGIFSTAGDLAKYCRMMLKNDGSIFSPNVLQLCFDNCNPERLNHSRSVGWDMAIAGIPGGLSNKTIYHSGWTGQSVWIDPIKQIFVIVLTNRCGDWTKARDGRINIAEEVLSKVL